MTNILCVEGASGVGKSTLVKALREVHPQWLSPPEFTWPRERSLSMEIAGNSVSDYSILATGYANPGSIILSDRGFLGHWVYQTYKSGYQEDWLFNFKGCLKRQMTMAYDEMQSRVPSAQHAAFHNIPKPKITILLLHTDANILQEQRRASGKWYPYDEANIYFRLATELQREPLVDVVFIRGPIDAKDLRI